MRIFPHHIRGYILHRLGDLKFYKLKIDLQLIKIKTNGYEKAYSFNWLLMDNNSQHRQ
jgi:hypothetical protein